jgi:non-specific serine/threonine protein kinase
MPTSLPTPITRFVGRARELSELRGLLQTDRLITLTGLGGSGKTRLALQLALDSHSAFEHGANWCDLTTLTDPNLLPQAIAQQLGLKAGGRRAMLDELIDALRERRQLLVWDNCEQVLKACAALADGLLKACPQLVILTTSLQPLGLVNEKVWLVPPLDVPQSDDVVTLSRSTAVALFIDRACEVLPTFELTTDNAASIGSICRRLDGLPLAIELAAARVKMLSAEQIDFRLSEAFKLLTRGTLAQLPRHQTLRAVMDWSYQFLNAPEQRLLRRLAAFAGSFTLEMAEAVCGENQAANVLDPLSDLVDKSLVTLQPRADQHEVRYQLLEVIRQYAREKLDESGEAAQIQARLLDWAITFAERAEPELVGLRQGHWLTQLTLNYSNLRAALQYACGCDLIEQGLRLANALQQYWFIRGEFVEGQLWFESLLSSTAALSVSPPVRAGALQGIGRMLHRQGQFNRARVLAEESLRLRRELGDQSAVADSLNLLGLVAADVGDYAQSQRYHEEGLQLRRASGNLRDIAVSLGNLGYVFRQQGRFEQARGLYEESLASYRQSGDLRSSALILTNLGNIANSYGDYPHAKALYEESLAIARQFGDQWSVGRALTNLAVNAIHQGDYVQAEQLQREALTISQTLGDALNLSSALSNLGVLAELRHEFNQAANYHEDALARWKAMNYTWGIALTSIALGRVATERGELQRATAFHLEGLKLYQAVDHREGIAASFEGLAGVAVKRRQAVQAARWLGVAAQLREALSVPPTPPERDVIERIAAEACSQLGNDAYQQAHAEGKVLHLEQALAEVMPEETTVTPSSITATVVEPELRIFALGPTRVLVNDRALASTDWTYTKAKELLFYFIANPPVTKAQIGLDVWPDAAADQLRNIFHRALHHLRKALGQLDWIIFADEAYFFNRSLNYWCDLHEFEALLGSSGLVAGLKPADRAVAIQRLEAVVQLWRGDFVEDLGAGEWVIFKREELRHRYVRALIDLGALYFAEAHYDRAVAVYRRLLALDNYLELAHRELMRSFARQGETGHAIQHYQHLREMLKRELQAEPSPETATLYERIRRGDEV